MRQRDTTLATPLQVRDGLDTTLEERMKETSVFTGFRWASSIDALINMSTENFEVRDADPRVMKLLFQNAEYFGANARLPRNIRDP